jgi:uncharacterized protein (TIGR02302 family)
VKTKFPTGSADRSQAQSEAFPLKVEAKVWASRAVLLWERAWPELWPAFVLAATYLTLSLFGLWSVTPVWLHAAFALATSILVVAVVIQTITTVALPTRMEALRRLEQVSGFEHRPLIAVEDKLASGNRDQDSAVLWRWHRYKALAALASVAWPQPRSNMRMRDPFALRAVAGLLLVIGLLVAGSDTTQRLADAFTFDTDVFDAEPIIVDAWVTPPAYTGRPPVIISGASNAPIVTPEKSELLVRVQGASSAPHVAIESAAGDASSPSSSDPMPELGAGLFEMKVPLSATVDVDVVSRGSKVAHWTFAIVRDLAPRVSLVDEIQVTEKKSLSLHYRMDDDYGIASGEMRVTLDKAAIAANAEVAKAAEQVAPKEGDTLVLGLPLPSQKDQSRTARAIKDLLAHPWAGLPVIIQLAAKDESGQTGLSEPVHMTLPEREFTNPLARAIIEQRKSLIVSNENAPKVAKVLDALIYKPEKFMKDTVLYLGMRSAERRLSLSKGDSEEIKQVRDLLYDLALRAEDGTLSLASNELRELMQKLADALKDGASDEEIERLMNEVREAMNRYLQQLAEQGDDVDESLMPEDPNMLSISPQDLEDLLAAIEQMSKSGARESAQQLLSELQNLMENLQAGQALQMTPQEQALSEAINKLGDLIDKQQQLMDETFKGQSAQEDPRMGDERRQPDGRGLAQDQEKLRKELGDIMREFGGNDVQPPQQFGEADGSMGDARDKLKQERLGGAVDDQKKALDAMRSGQQSMAQQLMQMFAERGVRRGSTSRRNAQEDPLGRESGNVGSAIGNDVKVPEERDLQRAREILEELQRRAAERSRSKNELDYIERLLRRF